MKIYIVSLFTDMFEPVLNTSMLKKAQDSGHAKFELVNLREYGLGPRKKVDDTPYGGGAGMVLKVEPVTSAVDAIRKKDQHTKTVLLSPRGSKYSQLLAKKLSSHKSLILLCGHYEGFDERIYDLVDYEISIGDYILTGGELPAMVVVDSIVRLLPGVLGDERSNVDESFTTGMLEYPQYTRPDEFNGKKVPEVLLSGDHAKIAKWRAEQSLKKTQESRPDLVDF